MTKLNLAELDRLEREATEKPWTVYPQVTPDYHWQIHKEGKPYWDAETLEQGNADFIAAARNQLRPLLDLVDRLGEALVDAELDLETFGDEGHIQDIAQQHDPQICDICFANEASNRACNALDDYWRAKENTTECEKCTGTGARHVAGEPVISESCGECSGEGVV